MRTQSMGDGSSALQTAVADRYADADPEEMVTVEGVGAVTLRRAVHKYGDWSEHHGLGLVLVYRNDGKEPPTFDMADLEKLAKLDRFR